MEPGIRYAKTSDGVNIAYTVMGFGPPLVYQPGYPFNNLKTQLEIGTFRAFYQRLAASSTVILFDHFGTGLPQRDRMPESRTHLVADLKAVLNAVDPETVRLAGWGSAGPVLAEYAMTHPANVVKLVMIDTSPRAPWLYKGMEIARLQAVRELANTDWELFSETVARVYFGWDEAEPARHMAHYLCACTTPEALAGVEWRVEDASELFRQR